MDSMKPSHCALAVEIVHHQEAAAQEVFAQARGFLLVQEPAPASTA